MTRDLGAGRVWYVEMVVPFWYAGYLFPDGGVIVIFENGERTAVTREHFARWWH